MQIFTNLQPEFVYSPNPSPPSTGYMYPTQVPFPGYSGYIHHDEYIHPGVEYIQHSPPYNGVEYIQQSLSTIMVYHGVEYLPSPPLSPAERIYQTPSPVNYSGSQYNSSSPSPTDFTPLTYMRPSTSNSVETLDESTKYNPSEDPARVDHLEPDHELDFGYPLWSDGTNSPAPQQTDIKKQTKSYSAAVKNKSDSTNGLSGFENLSLEEMCAVIVDNLI